MDEYKVIITADAENDLNAIDDYITFQLLAAETAISYIAYIRQQLSKLRYMPKRYKVVNDEPLRTRGIRRMNAKNFAIFYIVLEEYHEVYIQNIIYQKRNFSHLLRDLGGHNFE